MFTLGGEGRHELERVVASDYSRAQISIKLESMSSDLVLEQVEQADRLAKQAFSQARGSSRPDDRFRPALFSTLDHYLVMSQISSFGTAFFTVFGVIFIVFRSFRFGFLTIAPNLLPVVAVLGVMGYLDISMNIATVMVASVALGIVDDDTIHFINRYRREVAAGATTDRAIEIATAHEGRASLTTAVINSAAFAVLMLSEYRPTAWFGGLLALTMAAAFLAEVFILPATIKLDAATCSAPKRSRPRPQCPPRDPASPHLRRSRSRCCSTAHGAARNVCRPATSACSATTFPTRRHDRAARTTLRRTEDRAGRRRSRSTSSGFAEGLAGNAATARHPEGPGCERRVHERARRPSCRIRAGDLGQARRDSADRRDQPAGRVAVLLRGTQRGADAGAAPSRPRPRQRRPGHRGRLRPGLPARTIRRLDEAIVALQPSPRDRRCAGRRRRSGARVHRRKRAGRRETLGDNGDGGLERIGLPGVRIVRHLSPWTRPPRSFRRRSRASTRVSRWLAATSRPSAASGGSAANWRRSWRTAFSRPI